MWWCASPHCARQSAGLFFSLQNHSQPHIYQGFNVLISGMNHRSSITFSMRPECTPPNNEILPAPLPTPATHTVFVPPPAARSTAGVCQSRQRQSSSSQQECECYGDGGVHNAVVSQQDVHRYYVETIHGWKIVNRCRIIIYSKNPILVMPLAHA